MAAQREEFLAKSSFSSRSDKQFDTVVGHIEDIIVGADFQSLQKNFMEKHCMIFDDVEENKLVYTDIHQEYVQTIEQYLEMQLVQRMPGFKMSDFQKLLVSRKQELNGEVFEMLLTFTDFVSFKELMLDYKAVKEGRRSDFGDGFVIHGISNASAAAFVNSSASAATDSEPMRISLEFNSNDNDENDDDDDDDNVDDIDVSDGDHDGCAELGETAELATNDQLNDDMGLLVIGKSIKPSPPS